MASRTPQDEQRLIDYVLGQCDEAGAAEVRRRIAEDHEFAALAIDVQNVFSALSRYPVIEPPEDLVERTMQRVRAMRRTESLIHAQPIRPAATIPLFSFRELAALAAVVLLAVGIVGPGLHSARSEMRQAQCASNIWQISTAINHYASGNNERLPAAAAEEGRWLFAPGQRVASNSSALFVLIRQGYVAPEVFQCPSAGGKPFVVQAGMLDFPAPETLGYSYQYSLGSSLRRDDPETAAVANEMVILADETPVFTRGRFLPDCVRRMASENHSRKGQNVLYLSGSVRWTTHCQVGVNGDNIWLAEGVYEYSGNERPAGPKDTFLLPYPGQ